MLLKNNKISKQNNKKTLFIDAKSFIFTSNFGSILFKCLQRAWLCVDFESISIKINEGFSNRSYSGKPILL
tara:strand:- start:335 stop:547 length:213 start_codon:yes stop_codon:yes gene_type:complete